MSKSQERGSRVRGAGMAVLERGRACFQRRAWEDAFEALTLADQTAPLGAEDLQLLVWSAGLTGRDEELLRAQERLDTLHLQADDELAAARTAFWLGFRLFARGEAGRAGGWIGRAQRLVEKQARDCVEQGYLRLASTSSDWGSSTPCPRR